MSFDLILNDLSYPCNKTSPQDAQAVMVTFVDCIKTAIAQGAYREIRVKEDINLIPLATNYTFYDWLIDRTVDRELQRYARSIATKAPLLVDQEELEDFGHSIDVRHNGSRSDALAAAYLVEGLALSLDTIQWARTVLDCELETMNDNGDVNNSPIQINHISNSSHVTTHSTWIGTKRVRIVQDTKELRDNNPFEHILFCDSAFSHLLGMSVSDKKVIQFVKKLDILNQAAPTLSSGSEAVAGVKIKGESQSTMEKYHHERTFKCPDGETRVFEDHFKINPGGWRCHLLFNSIEKKFVIGYIGPHLSIASEN